LIDKSYAFVGTSYLSQCEEDFKSDLYENSWPQGPAPGNTRFKFETNIVQAVSQRHPNNKIYNCSEPGQGIEPYFKRVLELINRYDPDVFVLEVPEGERFSAHVNSDYHDHYELYFPVQEWVDGLPQNLYEKYREHPTPVIDSFQVNMNLEDLNHYWTKKTDMSFNSLTEEQWRGYKQVLTNVNGGLKSRHSDVIAQCEMINLYLTMKGKQVYWFFWCPAGKSLGFDIPRSLTMLENNNILQWEYSRSVREIKAQEEKENPPSALLREHFQQYCHDNGHHLHSKYMAQMAGFFDEAFE
jgi:hypothetical protein